MRRWSAILWLVMFLAGFSARGALSQSGIPHADAATFAAVTQSSRPVLIQFDASWCPYCKALQPALESLAGKKNGVISVFRIDIDAEPDIAELHGVKGLPTMIIFQRGQVLGRFDGAADEAELFDWVEEVIN